MINYIFVIIYYINYISHKARHVKLSNIIEEHCGRLDSTSIYALRSLKDRHKISLDDISKMICQWIDETSDGATHFFDFYTEKGLFLSSFKSSVPLMEKGLLSHRKQQILKHENVNFSQASTNSEKSAKFDDEKLNGQKLGRCTIIRKIAEGSSCKVYLAHHESLEINVAVKIYHNINVRFNLDDFRREARTAAQFNHPSFVRILDFDDGVLPHLVLEYVDGYTLAQLIKDNNFLDSKIVIGYLKNCAKAFEYLHLKNIAHRDIKPENIMITKEGEVKISDFGISRLLNNNYDDQHSEGPCGTPLYIAPEQALYPNVVDTRSDIYSLGGTFYHALTGRTPFQADNVRSMILKHLNKQVKPPRDVNPLIPKSVSNLIVKMMSKNVDDRFHSMGALVEEIRKLESQNFEEAKPQRKRPSTIFRFQR